MADMKQTPSGADPTGTNEYSASQAPDTQEEAHGLDSTGDVRLRPGGGHGAPGDPGMSGIDESRVPADAVERWRLPGDR